MIAKVRSFLEEQVDYYQYKNVLFCGKWLGHENYGNGGGDPLAEEETPEPNGIGFYGYYGAGTANICMIPVTQESLLRAHFFCHFQRSR